MVRRGEIRKGKERRVYDWKGAQESANEAKQQYSDKMI